MRENDISTHTYETYLFKKLLYSSLQTTAHKPFYPSIMQRLSIYKGLLKGRI